jgi:hypothetical protein
LRTPVMRTRSPSMNARGITATSGRHGRSCDGEMVSHHPATPATSATKIHFMRRRRDSHSAQIANAAKASANATRSHAHGKFE